MNGCTDQSGGGINPSTAPACKISGLKRCSHTPANSIFFGPIINLLSLP